MFTNCSEHLLKQRGALAHLLIETELENSMEFPGAESSLLENLLSEVPKTITTLDTKLSPI